MYGTPEQRKHLGKTIHTKKDLSIFTLWEGNVAIDPLREHADTGEAQRKLLTLPQGSLLRITGLTYRRCPWGVPEYYVCRAPRERLTFDMPTWQADEFVDWADTRKEPTREKPRKLP